MSVNAYFSNIKDIIIKELQTAQSEILIASAWFTNQNIFDILLQKLSQNLTIKLIILNDDINNRPDGLNFQDFINNGGQFYYGLNSNPMHNKYCIIDSNTVITGSYNYTYFAESINQENIVIIKDNEDIINKYKENFNKLIFNKESIISIEQYLRQTSPIINIFKPDIDISIKELENADSFEIKNVVYEYGQNCHIENIKVKNNNITITLVTSINQCYCIHGSQTKFAWFIRDIKNRNDFLRCSHYKITDIKINEIEVISELQGAKQCLFFNKFENEDKIKICYNKNEVNAESEAISTIGVSVPIESKLSCKIHFRPYSTYELAHTTIDLIEGLGTDNEGYRRHCFNINMKANRLPVESP